jgi:hypothetical protein
MRYRGGFSDGQDANPEVTRLDNIAERSFDVLMLEIRIGLQDLILAMT